MHKVATTLMVANVPLIPYALSSFRFLNFFNGAGRCLRIDRATRSPDKFITPLLTILASKTIVGNPNPRVEILNSPLFVTRRLPASYNHAKTFQSSYVIRICPCREPPSPVLDAIHTTSMATDSSRLHILIVGGGLAGLATASYLRERHEVTVLERSKLDFSSNDYAISVAPNTQRLLLEQGIEESHLKSTVLTYVWRCDANGTVVAENLSQSLAHFGTTSIFTRRSRLQAELHRLATRDQPRGQPARIIKGVKITTVDVTRGTIGTESGDTYSGDLIIGADGINSAVRAAVLSTDSGPVDIAAGALAVPSGLAAYLCTVPFAVVRDDPVLAFQTGEKSGVATFFSSDSRTRVSVFHADPENFQIVAYVPDDGWVEQFTQSGSSTIKDVSAERALRDFSEFHPSIQQLFTTATARDVVRIRDLDLLPKWHSGKAILIGDAAHAVTPHFGSGCNNAIEDAEALSYFLRDLESAAQISAALESFETIRMPRAHTIQFASRQVGGRLSKEEQSKAGQFDVQAFIAKTAGYTSAKDAWEALKAGH
ncbi:hypothetical protein B0H19DRAFT_1192891 [Mycena capillaripes]|nr:hypothetical protein B0H19DRAFT_1192891 [Mycena capillaripes]